MQRVGQVSSRGVGAVDNQRDRKPILAQRRKKGKGARPKRRHLHFLTERVPPIGVESVVRRNSEGRNHNFVTRENYLYLRASALNYARLLGKELGHIPEGNTGACIADLYHKLAELEPTLNLNIEPVDTRLSFVFWEKCDWSDSTLYWIHAKILESLTPKMREVTLLFFQKLKLATGMGTTNECGDLDWVLDCIDEQDMGAEWLEDDERVANEAVIASYKQGGKVFDLMEEIKQIPDPAIDMARVLSEVRPRKAKEKELLEILCNGLRFTEMREKSIFDYAYDPFYDHDSGEHAIELDRIIRFVYEYDYILENVIQSLNGDLECGIGECVPCTRLCLEPDTDSVFAEDPFPSEFIMWMDTLTGCINNW
jgi:hypothetical protein